MPSKLHRIKLEPMPPDVNSFAPDLQFVEVYAPTDILSPAQVRCVYKGVLQSEMLLLSLDDGQFYQSGLWPWLEDTQFKECWAERFQPGADYVMQAVADFNRLESTRESRSKVDMTMAYYRLNHLMFAMVKASRAGDKDELINLGSNFKLMATKWVEDMDNMAGVTDADYEAFYAQRLPEDTDGSTVMPMAALQDVPVRYATPVTEDGGGIYSQDELAPADIVHPALEAARFFNRDDPNNKKK